MGLAFSQNEASVKLTDYKLPILVVEDDEGLNHLINKDLRRSDFIVEGVFNGTDAIAHMQKNPDTLMLLDIVLPDMNASEIIEKITAQKLNIPFIVITGKGDQKTAVKMMKLGARDYLVKDSGFVERLTPAVKRVCNEIYKERQLVISENSLKESEKKYYGMLMNLMEGFYSATLEGKILLYNSEFIKILGLDPLKDYTGFKLSNFWYDSEKRKPYIEELFINGFTKDHIINTKKLNGEKIVIQLNSRLIKDDEGMPFLEEGTFLDITERIRTETELKESEEKLRVIFNSTSDGILVANLKTLSFLTANNVICQMLGYTLNEMTGMNVDDIHPAETLPNMHRYFEQLAKYEIHIAQDLPVLKKDGSIFFADITATPTIISGQEYLICMFRDITESKKMEEQLRQSRKMEAIGTMAGGIAHDFNNILAIIIGNAEMNLEDIPADNPSRESLEEILKASNRAKDLVSQILTFSRKNNKKLIPIYSQSIFKETLNLLRSTTPATISIIKEISEDCSLICANSTQLHQLLMNLFTNAVHSMNEKGEVRVSLQGVHLDSDYFDVISNTTKFFAKKTPGSYVRLSVSDCGTGIDEETIGRIFDPFYTTKEVGKGTGMGLSVVHGIVESHGGFIEVESKPGRGSTFRVYFPVVMGEEIVKAESTTLPRTGTERILFIDDEESILKMGKRMLESLGYKVTGEKNSVKALEIFTSSPDQFDIVITDQSMPNMSGSELVAEILQVRPEIPIILCTGFSSKVSAENAVKMGISKFITKPFDKKILAMAIRELLDGKV